MSGGDLGERRLYPREPALPLDGDPHRRPASGVPGTGDRCSLPGYESARRRGAVCPRDGGLLRGKPLVLCAPRLPAAHLRAALPDAHQLLADHGLPLLHGGAGEAADQKHMEPLPRSHARRAPAGEPRNPGPGWHSGDGDSPLRRCARLYRDGGAHGAGGCGATAQRLLHGDERRDPCPWRHRR